MSIALFLLAALLQPPDICLEQPIAGDLVDHGSRGGSIGYRAALQILNLVEHGQENEGRQLVALAYFFPEGMNHSGHRGGTRAYRNPATGCVEPWMHVFSDAWNLEAVPERPVGPGARQMRDPETWTNALRFEATLDGRARAFHVGDTTYDLVDGHVFAVIFDDELQPVVHQTDATLSDLALPTLEPVRELVVQRLAEPAPAR